MAKGVQQTAQERESTAQHTESEQPDSEQREAPVIAHLQRQTANALLLYTNYKHYHWQTYGPLFRDLHLLFDEFAKSVLSTVDDFAERIRMIGESPVSRPQQILDTATVEVAGQDQTMRQMVEEADANVRIVIREMRAAAKAADQENDPGTVDLFSRHVQIHEKHEWWLRDILERDDGLVK